MPYILQISPKAHEDISKIHKYISKDGIDIADKQALLIYNGLDQLAAQPESGGELSKKFGIETDYRFLVVNSPYIAFYKFEKDKGFVEVYRVLDGRQNYFKILNL